MGAYAGLYIGIYLEIPYGTKKVMKNIYKNPRTGLPMSTPFHPTTGEKALVEEIFVDEDKHPTPFNFPEEFDEDMFFAPAYCGAGERKKTFVVNRNNKYNVDFDHDSNVSVNVELKNFNSEKLVEEFKVEYKKYIDYLVEEYGDVAIFYGVVYYFH